MPKQPTKLADAVREAVKQWPMSRNSLCLSAGIDKGALSRFMAGTAGLSLAKLERLADRLNLHIVAGKGKAGAK